MSEAPATPERLPATPANPNLLRDRLANERTFLAWLRTGIAITSLGFVVARFDIFLQQLANVSQKQVAAGGAEPVTNSQAAIPIGVLLVLAGPAMVLLAAVRYIHTDRALVSGQPESRRFVRAVVIGLTLGATITGVGLAVHLLANWP